MTTLRMITTLFVALSMGLAFSHLLQLPLRMRFDGPTWLSTQAVFPLYASIGGAIEIGAILLTWVLAFFERDTPAFGALLAAAICLMLAFVVWVLLVSPANFQIAHWDIGALPEDWARWRMQWECSHATRFLLQLAGFVALLFAVVTEVRLS
jgi:hypothetical protein